MKRHLLLPAIQKTAAVLAFLLLPMGHSSAADPASGEWSLLAQESGINVYYQLGNCDSRSVMFLKFENTLDAKVKVDFHIVMEGNLPSPQIIVLNAKETKTGQCVGTPDLVKDVRGPMVSLPPVSLKIVD